MTTVITFEMLPDEMILNICGYLRGVDVLYSFFDLNARLNVTIKGYCQYINLLAPAYIPFHHVVSRVLPRIGSLVRSFVLNGNWKVVLSADTLAILFGSQLSTLLPHLQTLTLKWFTGEDMSLFLPNLENFSELVVLDIRLFKEKREDDLLTRILGTNNGRLNCVTFDEDCVSLTIPEGDDAITFPTIEQLSVNISINQSFPSLFRFLPNLRCLHIIVNRGKNDSTFGEAFATLSPLVHLIDFELCSRLDPWTLDEIVDLLQLMPSLQKLTLGLITEDERLIKAENLIKILPPSVTQIHVSVRYYFSKLDFNTDDLHDKLRSQSIPTMCLFDEARQYVLFYTVPYSFRSIVLPTELSEQMSSESGWNWKHMQQVEDLYVYNVKSLDQILLMVRHFRRIRRLTIGVAGLSEPCAATLPKEPFLIKLPHLRELTILGICPLLHLVQAASNLDYLDITVNCFKNLIGDEQICALLKQRITRLDIGDWLSKEIDLLPYIAQIFCNVYQLIIKPPHSNTIMDSTVLAVLTNWHDKQLHWLFVNGSLSDQVKGNLRQWLIEHTNLLTNDSFAVAYSNDYLTLWK